MKNRVLNYSVLAVAAAALMLTACTPSEPTQDTINSKVVMRSAVKEGGWSVTPEWPTDQEKSEVLAYVSSQTNPTSVAWPKGCTEYIVQNLTGSRKYYAYEDFNHAQQGIEGTKSMEHFEILENNGNWQHVYDFNRGLNDNQATHGCTMMTDGFNGVRTWNEYAGYMMTDGWCLFYYKGNYYLGLDFCIYKDNRMYVPYDGVYDDWIVKIIPLNGETEQPGEKEEEENPGENPEDNPGTDPGEDPDAIYATAHVEFDIHQQEHKDWKEIKTSIHIRDTVDFTVLLPIPQAYQAPSDDFAIRGGEMYEAYVHEIQVADKTYEILFEIVHKAEGIQVFVQGSTLAPVLRAARAIFKDGLTFEVHTYVRNEKEQTNPDGTITMVPVSDKEVWDLLKQTEMPTCSPKTHIFGQVTSAFYPEERQDYDNEK